MSGKNNTTSDMQRDLKATDGIMDHEAAIAKQVNGPVDLSKVDVVRCANGTIRHRDGTNLDGALAAQSLRDALTYLAKASGDPSIAPLPYPALWEQTIAKPVTKHAEEQKVCHDKKEPEELKKVGHSA